MVITVLLFVLGLILLIKGGDWFVDGAVGIARRFKMPELLIGATVVSIGTTLPEVLVSAEAASIGQSQIAYGNAIGSIICNTALIAALTAAIRPCAVNRKSLKTPVIFFFIAAAFYTLTAYITGYFSLFTGIILLAIFVTYMFITVRQAFKETEEIPSDTSVNEKSGDVPIGKSVLLLIIGAVMIAFGANLLVDNGVIIAESLGVPQSVIGLTFIAIGTSLPELITAFTSLRKGHGALSVGNIIGANLFNLVLVSGVAIVIKPFSVPAEKQIAGMNASFVVDIPIMLISMAIFTIPSIIRKKISRAQGIILLAIYAAFFIIQFAL